MYGGQGTAAPEHVSASIDRHDGAYCGGKASLDEVTIHFGPPETPPIHLLLVVPNRRNGGAPVCLWHLISAATRRCSKTDSGDRLARRLDA